MPAAVIAAVAAAGTAVGGAAGAFLIMNATAIASAVMFGGSLVFGAHQRRKAIAKARAAANASLEDRLIDTVTTQGVRSRCYGRVRNVDGVLFKATRGTNKEFYTWFVAVAGHEIDAFEGVYFGDTLVTLDGSGYVQDAPYKVTNKNTNTATITLGSGGTGSHVTSGGIVAGSVSAVGAIGSDSGDVALSTSVSGATISVSGGTSGQTVTVSWQVLAGNSRARVRFYTGAAGQNVGTVLSPLFPSLITTTDHRFAGIAGMLIDWEYDPDAFPQGLPPVTALFRGAKVLDPRTGTTAWTQNPALIARDWALHANGGGCAAGDLAAATFTAAANACDTTQAFTTPSGTASLPLYTCGIVCPLDSDPWQTFGEMVEAMAGKAGWAGGALRVVAGAYRAPVTTITEDWLHDKEPVQIVPEPPTDDAVNIYRPTIADKDQTYKAVQSPEVRATTYITADGRELQREITLGGVTDATHAQHVCGVLLREARNGLTVVLPCNLRAYQLELFDVVNVTLARFGWTNKIFEVVGWQFSMAGGIALTLKETAAAIYQPDSLFQVLDLTPNTDLPNPGVVPTIGTLTITSGTVALQDGTRVARVRVQWPAVADRAVSSAGYVDIQYWPATQSLPASGDWISAAPAAGAATETTIDGLRSTYAYTFRARFVNALGVRGAWGVQAVHVVSAQPPVAWSSLGGRPADADLLNSYQIIGQNLLQESDQNAGPRFTLDYNPNTATFDQGTGVADPLAAGFSVSNNVLAGNRAKLVFVRQANQNAAGVDIVDTDGTGHHIAGRYIFSAKIPVTPTAISSQKICASAYGNGHRCAWRVRIIFYNTADGVVGSLDSAVTYAAASNTNKLELMQRPFALGNVPSSAAYAVLAVVKYNTRVVAPSDSYLFWGLPQLEVVAANTQGPSPYSSGPVGAIGSEQILAKSATDFGLSAGIYGTGQIGNSAFDITQVEATRTWTNSTSAPVDVHVIGSVANVSTSFNGSYSTVTQSYTQLDYSVSSGGSDSVIMVAKAPPGDGTALAVSGSGQLYATVPVGATITANITSREANTTSGSAIGGSYQLSLTAVIK